MFDYPFTLFLIKGPQTPDLSHRTTIPGYYCYYTTSRSLHSQKQNVIYFGNNVDWINLHEEE